MNFDLSPHSLKDQMSEISFQIKYEELKSQSWKVKFYLRIGHVSTLLGVFIRDDSLMSGNSNSSVYSFYNPHSMTNIYSKFYVFRVKSFGPTYIPVGGSFPYSRYCFLSLNQAVTSKAGHIKLCNLI